MESVSNQPLSDHTIGIQPTNHVFAINLSVYRNYFLLRIETVHLHRFDKLNIAERSTSNKFSISDRIQESTHQGNRTTIAYVRLSLEKCCFNGKKNCAWKLLSWEMWRWTCRELVVSMMPLSSLVGLLDIEMIWRTSCFRLF